MIVTDNRKERIETASLLTAHLRAASPFVVDFSVIEQDVIQSSF